MKTEQDIRDKLGVVGADLTNTKYSCDRELQLKNSGYLNAHSYFERRKENLLGQEFILNWILNEAN